MPLATINLFSIDSFVTTIGKKFNLLTAFLDAYLANSENLRTISIVLMMLAIVLFLVLIAALYVKSLTAIVKSEQKRNGVDSNTFSGLFEEQITPEELEKIQQEELEKELERELEKAVAERASREEKARKNAEIKKKEKEEAKVANAKEKMPEIKKRRAIKKDLPLPDFDWKKGKLKNMESIPEPPDIPLQYTQNKKQLSELLGLIIDMLGRNVDDLKIAQTIMYRNMYQDSEDAILQTIDAIKDFVALCINGQFKSIKTNKNLPDEEKALFNLALGDTSLALALIEALLDENIDKASEMQAGNKRNKLFATTSNYALTFGSLAAVTDVHLATGAFELAIELYPQNINAWNRIGDMYKQSDNEMLATNAYQKVLSLADENINSRQLANAEKMLSQFYYAQGDSLQAAKLHNRSKGYYDSIGINRRLDRQEVEIIDIIEAHQQEELSSTINKILTEQSLKQYSFS